MCHKRLLLLTSLKSLYAVLCKLSVTNKQEVSNVQWINLTFPRMRSYTTWLVLGPGCGCPCSSSLSCPPCPTGHQRAFVSLGKVLSVRMCFSPSYSCSALKYEHGCLDLCEPICPFLTPLNKQLLQKRISNVYQYQSR